MTVRLRVCRSKLIAAGQAAQLHSMEATSSKHQRTRSQIAFSDRETTGIRPSAQRPQAVRLPETSSVLAKRCLVNSHSTHSHGP